MNSDKSTIIAAMLLVAAFAGVAIFADTSDAEVAEGGEGTTDVPATPDDGDDVPVTVYKANYVVAGKTYVISADASNTITLATLESLGAKAADGKEFAGWKAEDGTTYTAGSKITLTGDITLEAVFEDIKYTVKFIGADGSVISEKKDCIYEQGITVPEAPTKGGYIFAGWLASGATEPVMTVPKVTADVTYTAVYTVDHKVVYIVDGTTILTTSVSEKAVPAVPSKEGFGFVGWNDGSEVIGQDGLKEYIGTIGKDVTLTASWRADTLTIDFVSGDEIVLTTSVSYGDKAVRPAMEPVMDGHRFAGWTLDGKPYDFSATVTEDIVLVASFEEIPAERSALRDPVVISAVAMALIFIGFVGIVVYMKKDEIHEKRVARITKKDKKGGDGQA